MAIRMGGKTQAHTARSAYIGVRGDPVWSAEQVSYTTTQYMTRDSAKLYDAWDRWPIDEKGALPLRPSPVRHGRSSAALMAWFTGRRRRSTTTSTSSNRQSSTRRPAWPR